MPVRIDTIGIVTARRPAALARCLYSHGANAALHGRTPRFIVCDDAAAENEQEQCRQTVAVVAESAGVPIDYIGLIEKLALLRSLLARGDVPPEVLKFACFDVERSGASTYGANRNMLLLATRGRPVLMVDDDTVCETYRPIGFREDVRMRQAGHDGVVTDPSEIWPLLESGDDEQVCRAVPVDVLGEHERWLGGAVALTANGLIGDCGWGGPSPYLFLRGPSLARVAASDARYDACATSRRILRAVRQVVICDRTDDFMSTCFALDRTTLVPPFLPICRGSDRVFAVLLARVAPHACFAHLPFVLSHQPISPRTFWRGEITRSAAGIDLSTLMCALIETVTPGAADLSTEDRLRAYGAALTQIGRAPAHDFRHAAACAVRGALRRQIDALDATLASNMTLAPAFRRDASAYAASLRETCRRVGAFVPLDLQGRAQEASTLTQRVVRRFGELLTYWPTLMHAASDCEDRAC